jgi:hypothetical protein
MHDPLDEMFKALQESRKVPRDRWRELQVVCDVLNASKVRRYALLRAWTSYQEMLRRHDLERNNFLLEAKDGGWGSFKNPKLGRIGISKRIGRALAALIEYGEGGHLKTCGCGMTFVARRTTRKYCGERCKQAARYTDEYRKDKAKYMKKYRKVLTELTKTPLRFQKTHPKSASRVTSR